VNPFAMKKAVTNPQFEISLIFSTRGDFQFFRAFVACKAA